MNSVQLMGRLVSDPKKGNGVAMMRLAVDRPTKDKGTDYPDIKVFGKQGENVLKYLHKGSQCIVEGSIETGSYNSKSGETVYYTDVIAHKVEFIGGNTKHAENEEKTASDATDTADDFEELDEDVPF